MHDKPVPYHPHTIAMCGYSGSGKTTLMEKLVTRFSKNFRVGYAKHDAHRFVMDKEGKDTQRAWHAGAVQVSIADSRHHALIREGRPASWWHLIHSMDCDFVMVEGHKFSPLPKIVLIDERSEILDPDSFSRLQNVMAWVGVSQENPLTDRKARALPYFCRDDADAIGAFIEQWLHQRVSEVPLYGLLVSQAGLAPTQWRDLKTARRLLERHCEKVVVSSCLTRKLAVDDDAAALVIDDWFPAFGMAGEVLSALYQYPNTAFLVAPGSLALSHEQALAQLVSERNPLHVMTLPSASADEPALSIHEPRAYTAMMMQHAACPERR